MIDSSSIKLVFSMGILLIWICMPAPLVLGQATATLKGTVTLGEDGQPIHNVLITILQLKRTVGTNDQGRYEFQNLPAGRYDVVAHLDRVPDVVQPYNSPRALPPLSISRFNSGAWRSE